MATEVKVFKNKTFSHFISGADIVYPFDISQVPTEVSGCVLQWDADGDNAASLTRNRVGSAMSLVGTPTVNSDDKYAATFTAGNYINTGIDMASFNATPLTLIAIVAKDPGGQAPILGTTQYLAPQRMRGLGSTTANYQMKQLATGGAAFIAGFARTASTTVSEFLIAKSTVAAPMSLSLTNKRLGQTATQSNAAGMYQLATGNILIGGSVDGTTAGATGTIVVPIVLRAALIFNRILTDDEVNLVYKYYKNYYSLKSPAISL